VIEVHKAKLRARLVQICTQMGAREPRLLADQLFLLMEGAQVTTQTLGYAARQGTLPAPRRC